MSKINQLSNAIKFALFVGTTASLASVSVFAQEAKEIEAVEVVGSRIKQVNKETAQPVQIVTREEIAKTGLNNVYDVLNNITASDGSGLSTVTTQTNGSDGSQQISLRGLGSNRTLVLVDGKRWVTDPSGIVDLSTIPVAIIERIEVLKDGASAIYGSDAITGVVNLVTRRNYDGAQAGLYYGQTQKGDGAQTGFDLTIGSRGEKSSTTFSVSRTTQETIFARDRERSNAPFANGCEAVLADPTNAFGLGAYCGSASGQYGRFVVGAGGTVAAGTYALNHPTFSPTTGVDPLANGTITGADFHVFNNLDRYNFAPINYLQQPAERLNLFAATRYELTDNVSLYGRVSYTKRTSTQQLAEVPATISNGGTNGPPWIMNLAATSIFNPFGVQVNTINFRNTAVGPRTNRFDFDVLAAQLGLEGSFTLGEHTMSWDAFAQYNDGQYDTTGENYLNLLNLRQALGQSGYDPTPGRGFFCGASWATRIVGCVPYNITGGPTLGLGATYAGHVVTQADVEQMINYSSYTLVSTSGNTSKNYGGNVNGDLFELPGGSAAFALGFEYRDDKAFNQPDPLVAGGGSSNNFQLPTKGSTEVTEFYGELLLPLLKDVFLAKELELDLAVRKSTYKASGLADPNPLDAVAVTQRFDLDQGSPTTSKASIKWKPIDDLLVRASWGETFRAPTVSDLFAGVTEGFPNTTDPCRAPNWANLSTAARNNCIAAGVPVGGSVQPFGQIRGFFGANVNLTPESGENFGLGFVYSPSWVDGLDVSLDFWKIRLNNAILTYGVGTVLNNCYTQVNSGGTGDPTFCAQIIRDLATPGAPVTLVNTAARNVSSFKTQGVDLGIAYKFDTSFGNFRLKLDTTFTDSLKTATLLDPITGAPLNEVENVKVYNGSPNFEYRSVFTAGWNMGDFDAQWTTRYLSDVAEDTCFFQSTGAPGFVCNQRNGDGLNHSGGYAVHDLQVGWKAPWDAKVSIGARNIFGKEPPILYNSFAHSFDSSYDLPGGAYWYASYRQDF
jgi:iron complex outermembrane recepter protein